MSTARVVLAIVLAIPAIAAASPGIFSASVHPQTRVVTVSGRGFLGGPKAPELVFAEAPLAVLSASDSQLTAVLPAIVPGTWLLRVSTGNGAAQSDAMWITLGVRGARGPEGPQGALGLVGEKGDTGPQGIVGPQGDRGAAGVQGAAGDRGAPGADGAIGEQGDPGPVGVPGAQGEPGPPGIIGVQGPEGPAPAGEPGPRGPAGPQGPAGWPGFEGSPGIDPSYVQLAAGEGGCALGGVMVLVPFQPAVTLCAYSPAVSTSTILNAQHVELINLWAGFPRATRWTRCARLTDAPMLSPDPFLAAFVANCMDRGPTFFVARTHDGFVMGGFAGPHGWTSQPVEFSPDCTGSPGNDAFLFSMTRLQRYPRRDPLASWETLAERCGRWGPRLGSAFWYFEQGSVSAIQDSRFVCLVNGSDDCLLALYGRGTFNPQLTEIEFFYRD